MIALSYHVMPDAGLQIPDKDGILSLIDRESGIWYPLSSFFRHFSPACHSH
jgi:hypothetical protein